MPETTQSNLITTLKGLGANDMIIGFFAGYEYRSAINADVTVPQIPKIKEREKATGRNRGPSKAVQAILSTLTTATGGMTQTEITMAVGKAVRAIRMKPTLQTMEKRGLIYQKARKWFAGTAPTATGATQEQKTGRGRGRPPKTAASTTPEKTIKRGFSLADATLQAVRNGYSTPNAIIAYLQQTYGETVRSNHLGIALQRHRRGGRLLLSGDNWLVTEAGQQTAQAS